MPELDQATAGAGVAAKEAVTELLDVIFDWVVPIIAVVVGYLFASAVGLSGALGTVIDGAASTWLNPTSLTLIADLLAAAIWGTIAGALWHASGSASSGSGWARKLMRWVMRPIAAVFAGLAIGEIGAAAAGKVLNGGLGEMAMSFETKLATEV